MIKKKDNFLKYLSYSITLYNEYNNLIQKIKEPINKFSSEKYYLINKNYMKEIESILLFIKVKDILINNKYLINNLQENNNDFREIFEKIKDNLSNENIDNLEKITDENIEIRLSCTKKYILSLSYINNDCENNLYYHKDFQIINI